MHETELPSTIQTEVTILGAALLDGAAILDATSALQSHDFSLDSHQRVFRCISRMLKTGRAVDYITVMETLKASGELDAVGGPAYVAYLMEGVPRNVKIAEHCRILRESSFSRTAMRSIADALGRLQAREDGAEVVDGLMRSLTQQRPDETRWARDYIPELDSQLERQAYTVVSTGLPDLNVVLRGGYRTKELAVIGAWPSGGKSALCRQAERAALKSGIGTHAASVEIPGQRWLMHHAARVAGLPAWKTREPERMCMEDKGSMRWAFDQMQDWPYRIDDAAGLTIDALLSRWRLSAMRHETRFFTLDFLQLLVHDANKELAEIANIVRSLKQFAKEYDVSVLALAQLTEVRGDSKGDARPQLKFLRGSGVIRQIADLILLLDRGEDMDASGNMVKTGEDWIIVAKNRDGTTGPVKAFFNTDRLEYEARA
jgi:replicative DNA helicase